MLVHIFMFTYMYLMMRKMGNAEGKKRRGQLGIPVLHKLALLWFGDVYGSPRASEPDN